MSEALVKVDAADVALDRPRPREVIQAATEEANVLAEVIESRKLFTNIQGKRYVRVEGWTTLATLRGCLPREIAVHEMPEGRYIAEVELIRVSDGMVLTRASAECGGDGDNIWRGRPANARRSMAITRATGKACRVAFSWVMALAGYEVTPAEEMDFVGQQSEEATRQWPAEGVPVPAPTSEKFRTNTQRAVDAEVVRQERGSPAWRGKLVKMEMKEGNSARGPWTLYTFTGADGQKFGTFSKTIADGVMALDGHFVEIVSETTARGNATIVEYKDVTLEESPFHE